MRFNRQGNFNVPFCRKPERFSQAYITKIVNQVKNIALVSQLYDWEFVVGDFRYTLACATENDFVYLDPPYTGRHVDYYNSWNAEDEISLAELLRNNSFRFLLSTWHSNKYRNNTNFEALWQHESYFLKTQQHFYHVGATEILRNSMLEALVSNYSV
jgi:DNA adenine methylase